MLPSQFEGLFLSTKHTEAHIDQTIEAARIAFSKLKNKPKAPSD